MTVHTSNGHSTGRASELWFWVFVATAVASAGSLTSALGAPPSPMTGVWVAASGVLLIGSALLATRILVAADRARRGKS